MSIDWKAEYLKSVESGCITLDELREARAELDATNRQVEILSDALAESRREHEPENEPYVSLASVQEPVAWIEHHKGGDNLEWDNPGGKCTPLYTTPPAAAVQEGRDWSLLEATQESLREHMAEIKRLKAAQPAVPDALNPKDENPAYVAGWNDCRAEMLKGMK
jgi:hypothetical protein